MHKKDFYGLTIQTVLNMSQNIKMRHLQKKQHLISHIHRLELEVFVQNVGLFIAEHEG